MFLEDRNRPVFTMPYELWFSNQANDTVWGLSFDHREPSQRQFGPLDPVTGASRYYINPIYIRSLSFSATEFNRTSSKMEIRNPGTASADAVFMANSSASAGTMDVSMCLGMGFVSADYQSLTPLFVSDVLVTNLTLAAYASASGVLTSPGAVKYQVQLTNGAVWNIYAFPTTSAGSLTLEITGQGRVQATAPFTGLIQSAKVSNTTTVDPAVESIYDSAAGSYCKSVGVSAQASGSTGMYQLNFTKSGPGKSAVLMFAFPHHVSSFELTTRSLMISTLRMASPTKGVMTAVVGNQWRMTEPSMPTNILWLPVKSGSAATFTAAKLTRMMQCATYEIGQDFATLSNLDSMYYSGKVLAKFAYVCLTTNDVLRDSTLALTCLAKIKTAFDRFRQNRQVYKLVYDRTWRGLISEAGIVTGDPNQDFGNSYYNDHHFHYAYHIQAAAIIAYLDGKLGTGSWLASNKEWVNTLVRDVANPSALDTYYPVFRSFDWFHGHSWAKGLFESYDGKDEESSSEDYNFAYSMKMWGHTIGDSAMEARGNLMLAVMKRSINSYMLLADGNENHPPEFIKNRVSGILFENKVDHTTYFGQNIEYIQGFVSLLLFIIFPTNSLESTCSPSQPFRHTCVHKHLCNKNGTNSSAQLSTQSAAAGAAFSTQTTHFSCPASRLHFLLSSGFPQLGSTEELVARGI
jgi:endo-1,3(4)-beta-glucanase